MCSQNCPLMVRPADQHVWRLRLPARRLIGDDCARIIHAQKCSPEHQLYLTDRLLEAVFGFPFHEVTGPRYSEILVNQAELVLRDTPEQVCVAVALTSQMDILAWNECWRVAAWISVENGLTGATRWLRPRFPGVCIEDFEDIVRACLVELVQSPFGRVLALSPVQRVRFRVIDRLRRQEFQQFTKELERSLEETDHGADARAADTLDAVLFGLGCCHERETYLRSYRRAPAKTFYFILEEGHLRTVQLSPEDRVCVNAYLNQLSPSGTLGDEVTAAGWLTKTTGWDWKKSDIKEALVRARKKRRQ